MPLRLDIGGLLAGLEKFRESTLDSIAGCGADFARAMEDSARQGAPWTDRTGNARATLKGVCGWADPAGIPSDTVFTVGVEGQMPYSVYLELGFDGRFSILSPTVHHFAPDILLGFARGIGLK